MRFIANWDIHYELWLVGNLFFVRCRDRRAVVIDGVREWYQIDTWQAAVNPFMRKFMPWIDGTC